MRNRLLEIERREKKRLSQAELSENMATLRNDMAQKSIGLQWHQR